MEGRSGGAEIDYGKRDRESGHWPIALYSFCQSYSPNSSMSVFCFEV